MKAWMITGAALVVIYISYRTYRIMTIGKDLDKLIANGATILDVRTGAEYSTGHISGSVNIPLSSLHSNNIPLDTSKTYITCCSHGLRSVKAVTLLKERGFKKVYNGGAWADLERLIKK